MRKNSRFLPVRGETGDSEVS